MRMITYQVKIQTNSSLFGRMDKPLRTDCHKLEQPAALNHLLRTCKHVQFERFTKQPDNVINKLRHPALGRTQQFNEVCNPVAFAAVALLHEYGKPSGQKEPQRLQENNSMRARAASTGNEKKNARVHAWGGSAKNFVWSAFSIFAFSHKMLYGKVVELDEADQINQFVQPSLKTRCTRAFWSFAPLFLHQKTDLRGKCSRIKPESLQKIEPHACAWTWEFFFSRDISRWSCVGFSGSWLRLSRICVSSRLSPGVKSTESLAGRLG
jgi:hypothetical protein